MTTQDRTIKTVMHEIKKRSLTVKHFEMINPMIKKITFNCDDLDGFTSLSPDDHIKVFLNDGSMRDYTPLHVDKAKKEIDLAFSLHGNGPASQWAIKAKAGDTLTIGGPKGSKIVPHAFDWYLMIGDETSIPSILRRLQEMPQNAQSKIILEVKNKDHTFSLNHSGAEVHWIFRDHDQSTSSQVIAILGNTKLKGDFFTWVSLENHETQKVKEYLLSLPTVNPEWIKVKGYWTK